MLVVMVEVKMSWWLMFEYTRVAEDFNTSLRPALFYSISIRTH